jgi:diguanylate cyclase (GGDEF)-like protein
MTQTQVATPTIDRIEVSIDDVVGRFGDLPTLAPVAVEVIRLADDDSASVADIGKVISTDPGLTVRLLRLANTPAYSRGNEVTNLQTAAGLLGIHTLKMVTLGFTLVADLGTGRAEATTLWRRSLASSVLARAMAAGSIPDQAEDAFVAGLLANIGKLALLEEPAYAEPLETLGVWMTPGQEKALLGFTSDEVTARILTAWELPAALAEGIRDRSGRGDDGQRSELGQVLHLADAASRLLLVDDPAERAAAIDALMAAAAQSGRTVGDIEGLLTDLAPELNEIASTFDFEAISVKPADELVRDAQGQLAKLSLDLVSMLSAAQVQNAALAELNRQLEDEASTDTLTSLPNRRTFDTYLANQLGGRERNPRNSLLGLILFDLDRFKAVNDTHGHAIGDQVLAEIGRRLQSSVRRGELAARVGGEEFALVMPDVSNQAELAGAAERIRNLIAAEPVATDVGPLNITASVGGSAVRSVRTDTGAELYRTADSALYRAKDGGRNRVETTMLP